MTKKQMKILLAEDDKNLGDILKTFLEAKGFSVSLYNNGEEALNAFSIDSFDFCIFDVMMPIKDGFTLAKEIRKFDKKTPIIFLTAKSLQDDIVKGLQIGADDYITKPFSMEELIARINAILRRMSSVEKSSSQKNIYKIGNYLFDFDRQTLSLNNEEQKVTSKEADLLRLLSENANKVLDRTIALKEIWRDDSYFNARSMDVYVTKLRKCLKDDKSIELINVHGVGFKLVGNIEHI